MAYLDENFKLQRNKLLRISSKDKISTSISNSNFTVNLRSLAGPFQNILGYIVKYIEIPNVFYNISSNYNVLILEENSDVGNLKIVTLTVGQYNLSTLITELQLRINAVLAAGSVIVSLDNITQKLIFTFTGTLVSFHPTNSTIAPKIGLAVTNIFTNIITMTNIINLIGETTAYVQSREMANARLADSNGMFNVLNQVALNKGFGEMCYSDYNDDELNQCSYHPFSQPQSFSEVDIKIRDRAGNILLLPDNYDITIIIQVYYK